MDRKSDNSKCLGPDEVFRYLTGQVSEEHLEAIEEHLNACGICGALADEIESAGISLCDPLISALRDYRYSDPTSSAGSSQFIADLVRQTTEGASENDSETANPMDEFSVVPRTPASLPSPRPPFRPRGLWDVAALVVVASLLLGCCVLLGRAQFRERMSFRELVQTMVGSVLVETEQTESPSPMGAAGTDLASLLDKSEFGPMKVLREEEGRLARSESRADIDDLRLDRALEIERHPADFIARDEPSRNQLPDSLFEAITAPEIPPTTRQSGDRPVERKSSDILLSASLPRTEIPGSWMGGTEDRVALPSLGDLRSLQERLALMSRYDSYARGFGRAGYNASMPTVNRMAAIPSLRYIPALDPIFPPSPEEGRRLALLVGVSEYRSDLIADLPRTAADLRLMKQLLIDHCRFDPRDVIVLGSEARIAAVPPLNNSIRRTMQILLEGARPNDTVLAYFSAHGSLNDKETGFLLPADCNPDDIENTALNTYLLKRWLANSPARNKLLILDCHHLNRRNTDQERWGRHLHATFGDTPGLVTIASCSPGEQSYEWQEREHGLFTYFLAQGLGGEADESYDGIVDSSELFRYVEQQVTATAKKLGGRQTPIQIARAGEVPVFEIARVTPRVFFENFSKTDLGQLPDGWTGNGFAVQESSVQPRQIHPYPSPVRNFRSYRVPASKQRILQSRESGTSTVLLPVQRISQNFFVDCSFATNGSAERPQQFELTLLDLDKTPIVQVSVLDRHPECKVTANGETEQIPSLNTKGSANRLYLVCKGGKLQVQLNARTVQSVEIRPNRLLLVNLSLANGDEEDEQVETSSYPGIYSIRIGPL